MGTGEFQYGSEHVHGDFEIRRKRESIQKLEEENRRSMLRLAQQEIAEKEKKRNGRYRVFFKARYLQWHWVTYSCFDEALFLLFQYKY